MGSLKAYRTPTVDIALTEAHEIEGVVVPANVITVRGLDITDLGNLLSNNLSAISRAADLYSRSKNDIFAEANMQGFILLLAKDFPGLVSEVISIAADEPDAREVKLPFPLQLRLMTEISRLTLTEAGGLGNLFATLGGLMQGLKDGAGLSRKATPSSGSIGGSEKMSPS